NFGREVHAALMMRPSQQPQYISRSRIQRAHAIPSSGTVGTGCQRNVWLEQLSLLFDNQHLFLIELSLELFLKLSQKAARRPNVSRYHTIDDDCVLISHTCDRPESLVPL